MRKHRKVMRSHFAMLLTLYTFKQNELLVLYYLRASAIYPKASLHFSVT